MISGNFYRDSLRVQRFLTVITWLFEDIWVSNLKRGLLKVKDPI